MTLTIRTAVLAVSLLPACYPYAPGSFGDDAGAGGGQGGAAGSNVGVGGASAGSGGSSPVAMGVPCAVQTLVAQRCLSCHGVVPRSPMSLVTRAHFLAPSPSTPAESIGQRSVSRMADVARPMPPSGVLPAAERGALEQWVQMGMPAAPSCDAVDTGSGADGGIIDAGPVGDGIPCAVEAVLTQACRSCHATMPRAGAPMPLVTRAHLVAPSSNPALSVGALSLRRMRDASAPMPPAGALPASQIAAVESWVNAGMPATTCSNGPDAGPDPYAGPVRCSSGRQWNSGNRRSQHMNPGLACISCHTSVNAEEGREETPGNIGGTVFLTGREPDLCLGLSGGATVVVTGADAVELRLPVNTSGNFFAWNTSRIVRPYRARIEYQGRTRQMNTPQMSGDCNSCHTTMGRNNAPGRLVVP